MGCDFGKMMILPDVFYCFPPISFRSVLHVMKRCRSQKLQLVMWSIDHDALVLGKMCPVQLQLELRGKLWEA